MRELLLRLFATELPPHDVHGRATIVQLAAGGAGATVWAALGSRSSSGRPRSGRPPSRSRSPRSLPLEIISADSRQVYRRLDIGTAKPTRKERAGCRTTGSTSSTRASATAPATSRATRAGWVEEIRSRGKLPVVVGGTGLYVRALAEGLFREPALDPARRRSLDAWTARLEPLELLRWAGRLDPGFRGGGRQRAARAIEVALLTGQPLSHWQRAAQGGGAIDPVVRSAHRAAAGAAPADRGARARRWCGAD